MNPVPWSRRGEKAVSPLPLIGTGADADKTTMRRRQRDAYDDWIRDEALLIALLGAALALFVTNQHLRNTYELPALSLVLDTAVTLACAIVAVLAGIRFSVEGRRLDLFLSCGFFVMSTSTSAFSVAPVLGGNALGRTEAWAGVAGRLLGATLIAAAPFVHGRIASRKPALAGVGALAFGLLGLWLLARALGSSLPMLVPGDSSRQPPLLTTALALQAVLSLVALIGFGLRYHAHGEDLDRWLAFAATLGLFAELHYVFTPLLSSSFVSQGDFLRLFSYSVLLVGVWRAVRAAEFGRAVAEERARVAREIHDGLAQYLFAVATQTRLLEQGAATEAVVPRLKEAVEAAQQEARFAVLALSSASGNAPFDSALRRYVDFLAANGELAVDLEIGEDVRLGPDESIEVFRIVQEGLANVRRHARATHAEVRIEQVNGRRRVTIRDDGLGFDAEGDSQGQGLRNIRERARSIGGGFTLTSQPGRGTALVVVLRT
jgi:signal transduction histidine kinase